MNRNILSRLIPFYILILSLFVAGAWAGNRAVTAFAENAPVENRSCIIIDAGHGGPDGGATSCSGVLESEINLQIALKLRDVCHLLGYETKMIRTEDISIHSDDAVTIAAKKVSDLKNRVKRINETENALLVSIHQNFFTDGRYNGAQVFYPATPGSKELAQTMQESFNRSLCPGSSRQSKRSTGVYLMEHIRCTGLLIECGFLSNPEEDAKLRDPVYQRRLCCVIVAAISQYQNT